MIKNVFDTIKETVEFLLIKKSKLIEKIQWKKIKKVYDNHDKNRDNYFMRLFYTYRPETSTLDKIKELPLYSYKIIIRALSERDKIIEKELVITKPVYLFIDLKFNEKLTMYYFKTLYNQPLSSYTIEIFMKCNSHLSELNIRRFLYDVIRRNKGKEYRSQDFERIILNILKMSNISNLILCLMLADSNIRQSSFIVQGIKAHHQYNTNHLSFILNGMNI